MPKKTPSKPVAVHISDIVHRAPGELKPWPTNPRQHGDKQRHKLKASILAFGFTAPLLVDEHGVVLSGHCRLDVAKELNLASVPVRVISGLTEAKKRAYVIADNQLALLASWDKTLLKSELELLVQDEIDIEITGFTTGELDIMIGEPGSDGDELRPEDIPDDESSTLSRQGDLWKLGRHLLLCGSALEPDSFQRVMDGVRAQMSITDPPYNVPIQGHVCGNGKVKHKEFAMAAGEMSADQFTAFLQRALQNIHTVLDEGAIAFCFMDWRHLPQLLAAGLPVFGEPRQLIVWSKDNGGMGSFYRSQHELVYAFKRGSAAHINNFELGQYGRYRTNVWSYPGVNTFKGKGHRLLRLHPTVKPVALIADAIRDCSHRNGVVLDPFAGSGTLLIAAERTGRQARAIELDPQYVDVAVRRWQRITGEQAVLTSTGQKWNAVCAERLAHPDAGDDEQEVEAAE